MDTIQYTARDLAITYATVKRIVSTRGYSEGLVEALRAVYGLYASLPDEETQGRPIYNYPTNQGGKSRQFTPEQDREILRRTAIDGIRATARAKDLKCSIRHIQDLLARQEEENRLKEEDRRFWAMVIEKEHAKPKGKSGKGKGKDKTVSEEKSEDKAPKLAEDKGKDKAPDQLTIPGLEELMPK